MKTINQYTKSFDKPSDKALYGMPEGFDPNVQTSIETGYFVFTMMPSLRCKLNCPHCYLSLEERRSSPIMTLEQLEESARRVDEYYQSKPEIKSKFIAFYWYGGEPTDMGLDYMINAFKMLEDVFSADKGYGIKHIVLTSLIQIDDIWFDVFKEWGNGSFQTSFDGNMRGKTMVRLWEARVKQALDLGLEISTMSVVNNELIKNTPKEVLDYLVKFKVKEASFLPFMLNEQNQEKSYERFAPRMDRYSDYMIELMDYWYELKAQGVEVPEIGQAQYVISRQKTNAEGNVAGQTLFLMPEGDFVLPDYKDGYLEFMRPFGNILNQPFEEILKSRDRRTYLRRQHMGNRNSECTGCENKHQCIMEFWKDNRDGDECFGAKRFVQWLNAKEEREKVISLSTPVMA